MRSVICPMKRFEMGEKYDWLTVVSIITLCLAEPSGRVNIPCLHSYISAFRFIAIFKIGILSYILL